MRFISLVLLALAPQIAGSQSACDLNNDGQVSGADAELATAMSIDRVPCAAAINGAGTCNAVTVQRVINAALGGPCVVDGEAALPGAPRSATLSWIASASLNARYNIYRSTVPGGPYVKLNAEPVEATTYTDTTILPGHTYYYVATAVVEGVESIHSNQAEGIVP